MSESTHFLYLWEKRDDGKHYYTERVRCICPIGANHWAKEENK